jgi:hypothetical protein
MGKKLPDTSTAQSPYADLYRMYEEVLRLRREVETEEARTPSFPEGPAQSPRPQLP